ncbi:MAG: tetratricopeptide repeat protein [Leptolyngbya sp. SIO1E4]|nr:tetratricopeptide repeat protein [Leptolyngbya sp. SIO1E4]
MTQKRKLIMAFQALCLTAGLTIAHSFEAPPTLAQTSAVQAGYDFLERGWVDDAIRQFQQAVQQQPQSVSAQLGLAIAYQRAGQDANAWQRYQQVLALDPNNRSALAAVGELGGYRAEWQAAGINALTTLLQLEPQDQAARAQRALLLGYQGRFTEAIADYEIVLAANPTAETILGAAQIYTYSGNYPEGLVLFERYLATGEPLSEAAATAYAQTLQAAGRSTEAIELLETRLQADPESIQLRAALAMAYQSNQQTETALSTIAPLRDRPDATLPLARALSQIARQSEDASLYREAVALYQQALAATPNPSRGFITEVADVLSEDPATQTEALQLYDQLLAETPDQPALQTKRLMLTAALGQLSRAALNQQLLALLQPLPENAVVQQQIGQALIPLDDPDPVLLPIYEALLAADTPVDFLHFRVAQMQITEGNWAAARAAIAAYQATPAGAQDFAPDLLLAELERRQGNLEASAQQYQTILGQTQSPQVVESALLGLSGIRQSQQRWDDALAAYEQLLSRNPQSERAQFGRAYLALRLQQISASEAEAVLNDWLADHATVTPAVVFPELLDLVGTLPPATSRQGLYETLLAIAPEHLGLNRRYVQLLADSDPEQALAYVRQLTPSDPTQISLYFVQGEAANILGELTLASQAYEAILAQEPDNTDALAALGGVRFQQGRLREAETLYEQVLALKPDDWNARRILAELQVAQDYPLAALQQFSELPENENATQLEQPPEHRIQDIRLNFLRRRGFQPPWEQY